MLVSERMTRKVHRCATDQRLSDAVSLMWSFELGCLPVVDGDQRPVGMLTERDICLAAYMQDRPLKEIPVASAMSKGIFLCKQSDSIAAAERTMKHWQLRRLPVIDHFGKLIGILSLSDIARARAHSSGVIRTRADSESEPPAAEPARLRVAPSRRPL